jgi:hypothetical protein
LTAGKGCVQSTERRFLRMMLSRSTGMGPQWMMAIKWSDYLIMFNRYQQLTVEKT